MAFVLFARTKAALAPLGAPTVQEDGSASQDDDEDGHSRGGKELKSSHC